MPQIKTKMSKQEFLELRTSLGLTREEAAKILNVKTDTLRKWDGNKNPDSPMGPHPTAVLYLQFIAQNPNIVPPFWPERLLED